MQNNASLLLKFFDNLFKLDGCTREQSSSMITRILWPAASDSVCHSNAEIKEFAAICCEAGKMATVDASKVRVLMTFDSSLFHMSQTFPKSNWDEL